MSTEQQYNEYSEKRKAIQIKWKREIAKLKEDLYRAHHKKYYELMANWNEYIGKTIQ
jgi:hypothetical protein